MGAGEAQGTLASAIGASSTYRVSDGGFASCARGPSGCIVTEVLAARDIWMLRVENGDRRDWSSRGLEWPVVRDRGQEELDENGEGLRLCMILW